MIILLILIVLAIIATVVWAVWANQDTSKMTPEQAVTHKERVAKVDKTVAITNVGLAATNHGLGALNHTKVSAMDFVVDAGAGASMGNYLHTRRQQRQADIANGIDPNLPREPLHAARVAAETARRAQTARRGFVDVLSSHGIPVGNPDKAVSLATHVAQMAQKGLDTDQLVAAIRMVRPDMTAEQAVNFMGLALSAYDPEQYTRVTGNPVA